MDHREASEKLHEFRDGALDAAQRAAVGEHLEACAECRGRLERWERAARRLFRPRVAASEDFVAGVMARLEPAAPPLSEPWLAPALTFALAAAAVLLALPDSDLGLSSETLLLADAGEEASARWALPAESPSAETLLPLAAEEP